MDYRMNELGISDIFELFDEVMEALEPVNRVPEAILSGAFPPSNYLRDKEGNLYFEFAVAGYEDSEIDLQFKDDQMILELNPKKRELQEGTRMVQQGIRSSKAKLHAFVPASKFDVSDVEAKLDRGILRVFVPIKENSKPVSVKINTL